MKFKKVLAGVCVGAMAVSMFAMPTLADTLDSTYADAWTTYIESSDAAFSASDLSGLTSITVKVVCTDLNWGWNAGNLYTNANTSGWKQICFGGENQNYDVLISETNVEYEVELACEPDDGGWFQIGFGYCASDVFIINGIDFYAGDSLLGTLVDGVYTATPTNVPTNTPTEEPTTTPTEEPTTTPTEEPTTTPTEEPTATPTEEPTATPTEEPTATPTEEPTATPTEEPTATPTEEPTAAPTEEPTAAPTEAPVKGQTGSTTLVGSNWWAQYAISVSDLIGDADPSEIDYIKFTGDTDFFVGFNGLEVYQDEKGEDTYWVQYQGETAYEVDPSEICWDTAEDAVPAYYLSVSVSKNDNAEYTINWEVVLKSEDVPTDAPTDTPTDVPTDTPTTTPEPSNPTGDIAPVAGLGIAAVLALGAAVISKKKVNA